MCLRSAGFPIHSLDPIAAEASAAAVDAYLDRDEAWQRVREALPRGTDSRLLAALSDAHGARDQVQLAARERVAEAIERTSEVLRDVARDSRFREALIWQNRRALKTALDPLLRAAQARNSSTRQKGSVGRKLHSALRRQERNDWVFFGPVGWAEWACAGPPVAVTPGSSLIADCRVSFERLTGGKLVRHGGLAYAGRTLFYEDRRRNVEVTLGPDWARDLGPPLALVLRSAAWYVSAIGAELEVHLERAFEECAKRVSGGPVWLEHLMFNAANSRAGAAIVRTAAAAVNERWMSILNVDEGARRVEVTAQTLRDRVLAGFPESAPPWPSARYHSPDVLIAADGVESLLNGRFRFVLGACAAAVGLHDEEAGRDIHELRDLLDAWREVRRTVRTALIRAFAMALLGGLTAWAGIKWKWFGE